MSMDPNSPYHAPSDQAGAPQKGGGSKLLLGIGIGCGLVLLLCCGIGAGGVALFYKAFHVETNPAEVAKISEGIVDMDPPAGFEPKTAVSMQVPFTNKKMFTVAVYQGPNEKGVLMIAEFGQEMPGNDPEQLRRQLEVQMQQQQQQAGKETQHLQMEGEPKEIAVTVHGQETTFSIQRGKAENGEEFLQVQGAFQGEEGPAFLIGQFPASDFSEEDAEAFVKSIK